MKRLLLTAIAAPLLLSSTLPPTVGSRNYEPEYDMIVNNRVLARPAGKTITMMDVVRRLDLIFYRQYPELADSLEARYQYYNMGWRHALNEMINADLMIADAESKKITISDGDVREELESQFGPNVVDQLDKIGISYDEAWEIVKRELIVRQMTGFMISGRAVASITPERLREAYASYIEKRGNPEIWSYRLLSISGRNAEESQAAAAIAQDLLAGGQGLEATHNHLLALLEDGGLPSRLSIQLTDRFSRTEPEMAEAHRKIVTQLEVGQTSDPIAQVSRVDGTTVYRIFQLEERQNPGLPTFNAMENELRMELFNQEANKAETEYVARLRKRYRITDEELNRAIPADLQPVALR